MTIHDPMVRLTVTLSDGRVLSGVYSWFGARERIDFVKTIPGYCGFQVGAI